MDVVAIHSYCSTELFPAMFLVEKIGNQLTEGRFFTSVCVILAPRGLDDCFFGRDVDAIRAG